MKPLHYGLLAVGAAFAAGLAITMTQPPPIPQAAPAPQPVPSRPPAPVVAVQKPAPIPQQPLPTPIRAPLQKPAVAPAPVYSQPAKPAVRKSEPNLVAKSIPPSQWLPAPYRDPPLHKQSVQPATPAPQPAPVETEPASASVSAPAAQPRPEPRRVTMQVGMTIPIRVDESLSSERNISGDAFDGSLAEPLVVSGLVIAERGARVTGRVVDAKRAGRAGDASTLKLELSGISTSDGQIIAISTDPWIKRGAPPYAQEAGRIGGGAALGAIIGAITGGGQGAAIGAGIGGAAGAGSVLAMRGKPANVPSETIIRFRLATRVTIVEQQIAGH